jgi:hypothetical protein
MADFSTDIQQFQQNGTYTYKFDPVGNLIFNSSSADFSQVYLSMPLTNIMYNNNKIDGFYTADFEEFTPTPAAAPITSSVDLNNQLDTLQQENAQLQNQLNDMIAASSTTNPSADSEASKQVILELRKALGQGRVDSDFSDTFPYTPIKKPTPST